MADSLNLPGLGDSDIAHFDVRAENLIIASLGRRSCSWPVSQRGTWRDRGGHTCISRYGISRYGISRYGGCGALDGHAPGGAWLEGSFFPTCQVRVVRFYHSCSSSSSSSSFLPSSLLPSSPIFIANLHRQSSSPIFFANLLHQSASPILSGQLRIAVCTPGPQPQRSDRSVHPWTSTARIRSQCAPLDLNRKDPSAVCTPGPQPQGSPRSVHPWTSTARIRSQCASLDLNRKDPIAACTPGPQPQGSDRSVHRWTSTAGGDHSK